MFCSHLQRKNYCLSRRGFICKCRSRTPKLPAKRKIIKIPNKDKIEPLKESLNEINFDFDLNINIHIKDVTARPNADIRTTPNKESFPCVQINPQKTAIIITQEKRVRSHLEIKYKLKILTSFLPRINRNPINCNINGINTANVRVDNK